MLIFRYTTSFFLLLLTATSASAGGLYLKEFGQPAQGTAGSGANVLAQDASTAFENAAGVFNLEGDSEWMATGIVLHSSIKFSKDDNNTVTGGNGGDGGDTLAGGALFHARKLDEKWGLTFSLNSVAGSALDYEENFVGRYTGDDIELLTVSLISNIAYKVNDELSVAAGPAILYGQLDLEAAIPNSLPANQPPFPVAENDGRAKIEDGDDYDVTLTASALWQATDDWRFSLWYLGKNDLRFDSDLELTLPAGVTIDNIGVDVEITFPQTLAASAMYEVNNKLSLTARLAWEDWSQLGSVPISTNGAGSEIPLNWDDIWSLGVGFRYKTGDRWTYYGGIAYDSDPTKPEDRISILPADRQIRLATGFTYDIDEKKEIGGTLTYVDLGNARTNQATSGGQLSGDYSTNEIFILGVNFGWR
jgi:long-chain fatty acid transport protein